MGGKIQSGNLAHDNACGLAEAVRQAAVANVAMSPAGQKAHDAAEIVYHRAVIASARLNNGGNGIEASLSALRALGVNG
jgi:hypothetical protein